MSYRFPDKYNHILQHYGNPIEDVTEGVIHVSMKWAIKNTTAIQVQSGKVNAPLYINKALESILINTIEYFNKHHPDFLQEIACYSPRMKRTRPEPSVHTWALAVDINWSHNPMTPAADRTLSGHHYAFTREMLEAMDKLGWQCGYYFGTVCDRMHFQLKGLGI